MGNFTIASACFYLFLIVPSCFGMRPYHSNSKPVVHTMWDTLLHRHVSAEGKVNYQGFIHDSLLLQAYLDLLSSAHPNAENWSDDEELAYWINAYNAFTAKLVTEHYPIESIKHIKAGIPFINSVFDIKFIPIETRTYSLNHIEHRIIRNRFDDPRIHFALNCASFSCPKLQKIAFTAENLDSLLTAATVEFLYDETKNVIVPGQYRVSSLFQWYRNDFTRHGSVIQFINQYLEPNDHIPETATLRYMDYDWSLNE